MSRGPATEAVDVAEPADSVDEPADPGPDGPDDNDPDYVEAGDRGDRSRLSILLVIIIVIAACVGAGAVGWVIGHRSGSSVAADSVDAGFARDMSTHHTQAVVMAGYTRLHTTNASVLLLANDIYDDQTFEIGQMQGWLDSWGLTRSTTLPTMGWMNGHHLEADGLMPGMATPDEISHLETLTGAALDIDFLQLMIRHHQSGIPMEQYAAQHASKSYVRDLANKMEQAQSTEVIALEQLLRQLGASPLPAPA